MIEFIYELPGGMEVAVVAEVTPETIVIHRCASMTGELDAGRIWIEQEHDFSLLPLSLLLKQEASERAHVKSDA